MTPRRLEVPRVTVDFSDVQDFEALPEDEYLALIEKAEWRVATEDGKSDYINVQFRIKEEGEFKDRVVFTILSLSPKALFRMKQAFENLGIIEPDDELELDYDEDTMLLTSPEIVGLPCKITLGVREYEGRTQNEVKAITSADGAGVGQKTTTAKKAPTTTAARKPAARKPAAAKTAAKKFK
jgi:hypothetical protein